MSGRELAKTMATAIDHILIAREGTGTLDMVIEAIVGMIDWFNGKDVTSYLEAYQA